MANPSPATWWSDSPPVIPDSTRHLLETYSQIPPAEVEAHCIAVRDRAYAIHPYPCIGQWRFLHLSVGRHPLYASEILPRLRDGGQTYLDLGCCFAQDVRRLVADGVDGARCTASDLRLDFIEVGFDLFRDKGRLETRFVQGDVLDDGAGSALEGLRGKFDIVGASSLIHLFGWEDQKKVVRRIVGLLRPRDGSLVVGRQLAMKVAGLHEKINGADVYRHNAESWKKLWKEVEEEEGGRVRFEVEVEVMPTDSWPRDGPGGYGEERLMMFFSVRTKWVGGSETS